MAEAPTLHWLSSGTDRDALFQAQRASVLEMAFVAFVEGDDEGHVPALGSQAKEANGIMGRVEGSSLNRQSEGLASVIEGCQTVDAVVTVAVSYGDDHRQLAGVLRAVGS
jgi:hypothetical protein